jgi:hypothetical protein
MKKHLVILLLLSISYGFAEQVLSISLNTAEAAESKIKGAEMVAFLCEDCEVTTCKQEPLRKIEVNLKDTDDYRLRINEKDADLAYLYFYKEGQWINVASSIFYPIEDVPKTMPHNQCSAT